MNNIRRDIGITYVYMYIAVEIPISSSDRDRDGDRKPVSVCALLNDCRFSLSIAMCCVVGAILRSSSSGGSTDM